MPVGPFQRHGEDHDGHAVIEQALAVDHGQQRRRQPRLLQQPANRDRIGRRQQRAQRQAPRQRDLLAKDQPDAEPEQPGRHHHAQRRQRQHGPFLVAQPVHVDVQAAGEQHEGQQPVQEHVRQVVGRNLPLPPLPKLHHADRTVDQDNDDRQRQRAGHQRDRPRQPKRPVIEHAQHGGQHQQGGNEGKG